MRTRGWRTRVALAGAGGALLGILPAIAQAQMSWTGAPGANWGIADNWDPKVVPHNSPPTTFYSPIITTGSVNVDALFNIAGLTNQGTVGVPVGGQLSFIGSGNAVSINNTGTISIAP